MVDKARSLYEEALKLRKESLPAEHPDIAELEAAIKDIDAPGKPVPVIIGAGGGMTREASTVSL
jgi:hypothetical protein